MRVERLTARLVCCCRWADESLRQWTAADAANWLLLHDRRALVSITTHLG
jgi:hypothetical protein